MSDADTPRRSTGDARSLHDALVADLVSDLQPVRPVGQPWSRVLWWLSLLAALALLLGWFADMPAVEERLMAVPDMVAAVLGSIVTTILASIAAFQLSLPDRSPRWALLPLPGLAVWIGASGMGCARGWLIPGLSDASFSDTMHCMRFIIGLSVPMSLVIFIMLRRGFSLYPTLTGAMAGLAVASAAATLLNFFHPYDAALTDLAVHAVAVAIVVAANRYLGGFMFGGRRPPGIAGSA